MTRRICLTMPSVSRFAMADLRAITILLLMATPLQADPLADARHWIKLAVERLCPQSDLFGFDAQTDLPGSWVLDETRSPEGPSPRRIVLRMAVPGGAELTIERRQAGGQLRQFRVSYTVPDQDLSMPGMQAFADGNCTVQSGRAIRFEGQAWRYLDQLEGDLQTLKWTETLQAPWPEGRDDGDVRVALVDSGLAYDLPYFENRLARDANGVPLGYDYWDMDPWPYDGDVSRGPFLPIRHGTAVASVLVQEAPGATLVPFRYPRPDMSRMDDLLARAVSADVRILAMPLGSGNRDDWTVFDQALRAHDILAIVSAGNDGRDIDVDPIYPAALTAENIVTVTSADAFGRLAPGSNWGARSVDIMLPAENVGVVDFRGASGRASGSSYAVPRLAALAARILAREPDLTAAQLKARIFERASPSPYDPARNVAVGWIPDPLAD